MKIPRNDIVNEHEQAYREATNTKHGGPIRKCPKTHPACLGMSLVTVRFAVWAEEMLVTRRAFPVSPFVAWLALHPDLAWPTIAEWFTTDQTWPFFLLFVVTTLFSWSLGPTHLHLLLFCWFVVLSSRVNNEGSVTNLMQTSFYGLLWYLRVFEAK